MHTETDSFVENMQKTKSSSSKLTRFFSNEDFDLQFIVDSITKSSSSLYVYCGDVKNNIYYVSDNFRDTFGFERNIIKDFPEKWKEYISNPVWSENFDLCKAQIVENHYTEDETKYQIIDRNGKLQWIHVHRTFKWDDENNEIRFVVGRLLKQDECFGVDYLTNFLSENTLMIMLNQLEKLNSRYITIGFGLNHIAEINTKYGRKVGDRLVSDITTALMEKFTDKMLFYRLLGMRCMAVVNKDNTESESELVYKIRTVIEGCYRKMNILVQNPCSFSVMHFPNKNLNVKDYIETMVSLIKLSETNFVFDYIEDTEENLRKIRYDANLKLALFTDVNENMKNFRVLVQPVVSAKTAKIKGGEILMRWNYGGVDISPEIFIPILESNQLIQTAGLWMVNEAIKTCAKIIEYIPDFLLSINISMYQLADPNLFSNIASALEKYKVSGSHIALEITESCADKEPLKLQNLIDCCHKVGMKVAMDDFGSGYSSISTLMHYDMDIIKFDKEILYEMSESDRKANFIGSIVSACHMLNKKTCAEGIEKDYQLKLCRKTGFDYIQGFYFYIPESLDNLLCIIISQN